MSFFKKIGKTLKKALPIVGGLASFIPGVGQAVSGVLGAAGRMITGSPAPGGSSAESNAQGQMPPVTVTPPFDWGKALGAVAPLGAAAFNYYGQKQTNVANAEQAAQQMQFQERMSSTGYQRATSDMKASGLNPMLAYSQGPASSPGGAQAVMGNELGGSVSSALSAATAVANLGQLEASTYESTQRGALTRQEALNAALRAHQIVADTNLSSAREAEARKAIDLMIKQTISEGHRGSLLGLELPGARNRSGAQDSWWMRNVSPYLNDAKSAAGIAADVHPISRSLRR